MIPGRTALVVVGLAALPQGLPAQTSLASDLWHVAAGTVADPAPLVGGAAALLWTPVVRLTPGAGVELGLTSFHAPEEIGVTGGAVSLSLRAGSAVLSAAWGRLGIDGIVRTETSPEAVAGDITVDAQVLAVGVSRPVARWLDGGVAFRLAADRLGGASSTRAGLDAGLVATPLERLRFGAAVHAVDPTAGGGRDASASLGAEARSGRFAAFGGDAALRLRYGTTLQHGEAAAHLVSGGMLLGDAVALDVGGVRESRSGDTVWRSRMGATVTTQHYQIQFGRDGGVNGFGATYALGLLVRFK